MFITQRPKLIILTIYFNEVLTQFLIILWKNDKPPKVTTIYHLWNDPFPPHNLISSFLWLSFGPLVLFEIWYEDFNRKYNYWNLANSANFVYFQVEESIDDDRHLVYQSEGSIPSCLLIGQSTLHLFSHIICNNTCTYCIFICTYNAN